MPTVCVNSCGLNVDSVGQLSIDWQPVGTISRCATADAYSSPNGGGHSDWSGMRNIITSYTNDSCRKQVVNARLEVPWIRMRVGEGNYWFVRGDLRGSLAGAPDPETASAPDLMWSVGWSSLNAAGTDNENTAPGATEHEYYVDPGATLTLHGRIMVREQAYVSRPTNLLEAGAMRLTYTARPSKNTATVGELC